MKSTDRKTDWSKYPRCPVCFASWACRRIRWSKIGNTRTYCDVIITLNKRPHKGRRQRDKVK